MLLAQGHRPVLLLLRGRSVTATGTFLVLLGEVVVVETHVRDVVRADVEEHEFFVQEGILGEGFGESEDQAKEVQGA
jgi:hypothetical protein